MLLYCVHQRRLERFEHDDNLNNNMQRHLLEDSVVQDGQAEWQCSVCYHENHPAKRECLMCGTPEVISQGVAATTTKQARKSFQLLTTETPESQAALAARNRSFHRQTSDGTVVTDELKPGGKDIPVTDANKEEYLTLLLKHKMFAGVGEQLAALLQGLYDVLPRSLLAVFDYQELELLLCGVPSIDVADWESHTDVRYVRAEQGFNSPTSSEQQVVQWFWEAVRVFSQEERARLLQFVTGTSRVPAEGFRALLSHDGHIRRFGLQLVSIGAPPTGLYPKAHTCFNRLDLPVYRSYEELVTYLTLVINMEITGFTMQ
ncbi:HECT E3 ubiquitin ligase [Phytophthora cinnamomi]|uniref:HECT E3 ubiquitin ligase n=1 Tax=Phytophthora cinnamomi TaxID=4785 RepID=UPI00355A321D|nr:HECT E3 ubiquitin ligase [Phytophthora cinnamomi]